MNVMEQPTEQESEALRRMPYNGDGRTILGWIERSLREKERASHILRDDTEVRWDQGQRQILSEILETARNTDTTSRRS